jgi:hypothetical protein
MKDELARLSEHIGLAPSQFVLGVTGEAAGEGQAGGQGAGRQSAEALLLARVNGLESAFREYVQAELDIHKDQDAAAPDLHGQLNATRCGNGVLFAFSLVLCHICPEPSWRIDRFSQQNSKKTSLLLQGGGRAADSRGKDYSEGPERRFLDGASAAGAAEADGSAGPERNFC